MQGFPGGNPDPQQLQATMLAIEQACSLIQVRFRISLLANKLNSVWSCVLVRGSVLCSFGAAVLDLAPRAETSQMPNARFQAAGAIGDAAIREWGILADDNKRSLILYCLNYVMEHASSPDGYVQSKVSAVAARLLKRGWVEFPDQDKATIFFEVEQSIRGIHGPNRQFAAINFLENLISEFSPLTASAMGLPKEFHEQCEWSTEVHFLKMLKINSGLRSDTINLKKFERSLVKPGSMWREILISSGHTTWVLNFYTTLRQKYSYDTLWVDSPLSVSCRQLIVQLCSLAGSVFPNDNGDAQVNHLMHILAAAVLWIEPPDAIAASIRNGGSESEFIDGCHVLLSVASLTTTSLFDNLLKSIRQYGTINLLSALTAEAVKSVLDNQSEEETWGSDALDILLETWNVILGDVDADKTPISADGALAASSLFKIIVDSHLKAAAADSAFEDTDDTEYFHVSVSKRDEQLALYALIARAAADTTIPYLAQLFSERFARLSQKNGESDPTQTLEELYWLLLITSHVLTDSGEGETLLIPEALQAGFPNVFEAAQHPVVTLSWSIINFTRQCLDPGIRAKFFSPRLMECQGFLPASVANLPPKSYSDMSLRELIDLLKARLEAKEKAANGAAVLAQSIMVVPAAKEKKVECAAVLIQTAMVVPETATPSSSLFLAAPFVPLRRKKTKKRKVTAAPLPLSPSRQPMACLWTYHLCSFTYGVVVISPEQTLRDPPEGALEGLRRGPRALTTYQGENELQDSWRDLTRAFASGRSLLSLSGRLQRSLAETLACAAACIEDPEASAQYLRELMGPVAGCLVENASRSDLKSVAQQADVTYMVCCLLERLRGAARAAQPRTQKVLFEMGHTVMNSLLTLLEAYKNQSTVVYMILKFVVDFVDGQAVFLDAKETSALVMLSLSSSLRNESQAEKYKDLRALLRLLTNICSKDLVGFLSDSDEGSPDIAEIGNYIPEHYAFKSFSKFCHLCWSCTPLISLDLLKYPKLSRDYFVLTSHLLEVYPEKDSDIVERCLAGANALASYHFREKLGGRGGLDSQLMESEGSHGKVQERISSHFLRLILQLLLFEDFRVELAGSAADALLPLLFCEQELYQGQYHQKGGCASLWGWNS
ncbi:hypothetical protein PR202_gb08288 [Eleusine coracana subsp. coracana]|uniref:Exportin-4 n=1 Tax=Eleusine coracana subsp. coracana TaxID=191504 RepID=A0AAV5ECP1_ELECO|nr:hypothetical protein PR202_gb08288 [Eleusine coracana subsp. coracana]